MSIPVPLERLRAAIAERGAQAYLLTVTEDGRPHAVHGSVRWDGDVLATDVGKRTAGNVGARPDVSLLFPVRSPGDVAAITNARPGLPTVFIVERGSATRNFTVEVTEPMSSPYRQDKTGWWVRTTVGVADACVR